MSLWFTVRDSGGGIGIGSVEIVRREPTGFTPAPDMTCRYEVFLDDRLMGEVSHRYGDGAWRLIGKAMDVIAPPAQPDPAEQVRQAGLAIDAAREAWLHHFGGQL